MKNRRLIKILVALFPIIWGIITAGLFINLVVEYEFYVKFSLGILSLIFASLIPIYLKQKVKEEIIIQNVHLKTLYNFMKRKFSENDDDLPQSNL